MHGSMRRCRSGVLDRQLPTNEQVHFKLPNQAKGDRPPPKKTNLTTAMLQVSNFSDSFLVFGKRLLKIPGFPHPVGANSVVSKSSQLLAIASLDSCSKHEGRSQVFLSSQLILNIDEFQSIHNSLNFGHVKIAKLNVWTQVQFFAAFSRRGGKHLCRRG